MAKSKRNPGQGRNTKFQLSQKSLDVLSMGVRNLSRLTLKEQKATLRQLVQTANRRIKSLERLSLTPTALRHVHEAGYKKFSLNVTEKELHKEYAALQDFFTQKSSTYEGAVAVEKEFFKNQALMATMTPRSAADLTEEQVKTLYRETGGEITPEMAEKFAKENIVQFWDIFHEIQETDPNYREARGSLALKQVYEREYDPNENVRKMKDRILAILKSQERGEVADKKEKRDVFSAGRNSL